MKRLNPFDKRDPRLCRRAWSFVLALITISHLASPTFGQADIGSDMPPHIRHQLDAIQRRVEELNEAGRSEEASEIGAQFEKIMKFIRGEAPLSDDPAEGKIELHVAGVYEGRSDTNQTASVRVTYAKTPIILALCAYDPVWWTIDVAPGVEIKKIILGGYHHQEIEKGPDGVPVEKHVYDDGERDYFQAYSVNDDSYAEAMATLEKLTGLKPTSFIGTYRPGEKPLVVGEANLEWRLFASENRIQELYDLATAESRKKLAERFAGITFPGLFYESSGTPFRPETKVGMLKVSGPVVDTLKSVRSGITQIAVVPETDRAFGVTKHDLFEIDLESGDISPKELANRKDLPRFSWTAGVTFDSKRRRLIVLTSHVYKRLYAYEIDNDHWSLLATMRGESSFGSIAYHPKEDVLYLTGTDSSSSRRPGVALHRFDPEGKRLDVVRLSYPIDTGKRNLGRCQLAWLEDEFFVIITQPERMPRGPEDITFEAATAFVVNGKTGEIVLEMPHEK